MRKSKPLIAGRVTTFGHRPVVRPLDDGVMAIPISDEKRADADMEMKDFINQQKKKEKIPLK